MDCKRHQWSAERNTFRRIFAETELVRLFVSVMSVSMVSVSLIIPFFLFPHVNKSSVDLTDSSEDNT